MNSATMPSCSLKRAVRGVIFIGVAVMFVIVYKTQYSYTENDSVTMVTKGLTNSFAQQLKENAKISDIINTTVRNKRRSKDTNLKYKKRKAKTLKTTKSPKRTNQENLQEKTKLNEVNQTGKFLVDGPSCRIPNIDPFDPSIKIYIDPPETIHCENKLSLTYQKGDSIFVDNDIASHTNFHYCTSDTILRQAEDEFSYYDNKVSFTKQFDLKQEFTRVRCYNRDSKWYHENFYAIFVHKGEPEKRYNQKFKYHKKRHGIKKAYNILMIGTDGVSRLSFMRHITKTRKYLLTKLGAIDMGGYNKVDDNTFVNIVPMMSGKYVAELPWSDDNWQQPFDKYDFVFKRYAAAGYRTLWVEDDPEIAIFNYRKVGFENQIADYSNRHFTQAMESEPAVWSEDSYCVNNRAQNDINLDYVYRYAKTNTAYRRPFFGFVFITKTTHYSMNAARYTDANHIKFIKKLHKGKVLDNTILIYFSDHGTRYGAFRNTYSGKMEARLPPMYIYLPLSFRENYPKLYKNVQTNAHRLTTPFDVYQTLRDVLYFNSKVGRTFNPKSRGISLFSEIPLKRSCKDASITPHWCACATGVSLPTDHKKVTKSAELIVNHLNLLTLTNRSICQELTLKNITRASKFMPDAKMLREDLPTEAARYASKKATYYQVTITTTPGDGRFEVTLSYDVVTGNLRVTGDISRTNLYGKTSECVHSATLKKVCYCK